MISKDAQEMLYQILLNGYEGLCRKFFSKLKAALTLDAIMLRVPQRPEMAIDCRW